MSQVPVLFTAVRVSCSMTVTRSQCLIYRCNRVLLDVVKEVVMRACVSDVLEWHCYCFPRP